jgi:hypothetical protein
VTSAGPAVTASSTTATTPVAPPYGEGRGTRLDDDSCVVRLNSMVHSHAIEHGSSRAGRWLRERRLRLTLWLAAFEGLLYILHVLHWWAAVALAVLAVGLYWLTARANRSDG